MTLSAPPAAHLEEMTAARTRLVLAWHEWRESARAHVAAKRENGTPFISHNATPRQRLDAIGLGLPTLGPATRAEEEWRSASADYRALSPLPEHAYVALIGRAYEATCPLHPSFRRVAWTRPATPASSAHEHNRDHHSDAPVRVIAQPTRTPSSLLP